MRLIYGLAALVIFGTNAFALDFTTPLHAISGGPFKDDKGAPVEMLLGSVAENALLAPDQADTNGTEKNKAFWLAVKLHEKGSDKYAKDANLTAEEITRIKDKIGKFYPPAIVGAAWQILDPASVPK